MYEYQAEILRIIDGDTLKARVDLGFRSTRSVRRSQAAKPAKRACGGDVHAAAKALKALAVTLRLARIDAPEMPTALRPDGRGQDLPGQLARAFVCQELEPVTMLRVATRKTGKYGRWIAEVVYQISGQPGVWHNLSDRIVAEGHGQWTPS